MMAIVGFLRSVAREKRLAAVIGLTAISFLQLCIYPSIPLSPSDYEFADQRILFGIPNAIDVLSNVLFLIVGVWGLKFLLSATSASSFLDKRERLPYLLFFAGVTFTGVGSAYYHLAPSDSRLPWDLLALSVAFMSLLAATIVDRISLRGGRALLPVLLLFGIAGVGYWRVGELHGLGDYKFYLFTQYFAVIAIAVIIVLFPPRYTHTRELFYGFVFYVLAKILELLDYRIYSHGRIISGHTLKHLSAGVACYCVLCMLKLRRVLPAPIPMDDADRQNPGNAAHRSYG